MKHFGKGLYYPHRVVLVTANGNKNDNIMFLQKRSQFFASTSPVLRSLETKLTEFCGANQTNHSLSFTTKD